jgi:hypothetical protein
VLVWISLALPAATPWLCGCGSPPEPKGPAPVKVEWSSAGGGEDTSGDSQVKPGEVDLDAPPPKKAGAAKKEAPPAQEPPKEPAPEPRAESTPAAVEDETESAVEGAAEPAATEPAAATPLGKEMHAAVKSDEKPSASKPPAKKHAAAATAAAAPKPASAYTGPNPCKTTHFSVPRVKEACENGGRTAAKGVMKDAIGKALAAGASLKCGDCHAEQTNYTLKKDAVAQLKKWLGP